MVGRRHVGMHVGIRAELRCIAFDHRFAQRLAVGRNVERVAFRLHRRHRALQRVEHRKIGRRAGIAAVGREVEQHDRNLARSPFGAAQAHDARHALGQHVGALGAHMHVAAFGFVFERAMALAAFARNTGPVGATAEHDGARRPVEFRDRHHNGAFDRQQTAARRTPLLECLELDRMGGQIRYVEGRENFFGCLGVVVGRAADQRESGEGHDRIDDRATVLAEEFFDGWALVESACEDRHHAQAARFEGSDRAVVVARIVRQQIRAQHEQADCAANGTRGCGQQICPLAQAALHARVVDADIRIVDGRLRIHGVAQIAPCAVRVAPDQQTHHVREIGFRASEPVLQHQEISAHVLCRAGDEAQQLGQLAQHLHLPFARGLAGLALAAQALQPRDSAKRLFAHVEFADARELHDLARRQAAHDRVAFFAPRQEIRHHGAHMVFQEQHGRHDDVGARDVFLAAFERFFVRTPFVGGVDCEG